MPTSRRPSSVVAHEQHRPPCALVTGGAGGIGTAIVDSLVTDGWKVAACDLAYIGVEIRHDQLAEFEMDVASLTSVKRTVSTAGTWLNGIDAVVTAAGICHLRPFDAITEDDWQSTHDINLKGVFHTIIATLPYLRQSERPAIVNVASDAGVRGSPLFSHYAAAKFGVVGLTLSLAAEFGNLGITVNVVCPGIVDGSPMTHRLIEEKAAYAQTTVQQVEQSLGDGVPLGRLITTKDVAATVSFLTSEAARSISGVALLVDAGASMHP